MGSKALVVDDEPLMHDVLRAILEYLGLEIDEAWNGHEGLAKLLASTYDVAFVDRTMPGGMFGEEMIHRARNAGCTTPIIFMTGEDVSILQVGMAAGATEALQKPFGVEQLEAVLHKLRLLPQEGSS